MKLGAGSVRDRQSQISSKESVTQETPLATIVEDSKDNHLESSSRYGSCNYNFEIKVDH